MRKIAVPLVSTIAAGLSLIVAVLALSQRDYISECFDEYDPAYIRNEDERHQTCVRNYEKNFGTFRLFGAFLS